MSIKGELLRMMGIEFKLSNFIKNALYLVVQRVFDSVEQTLHMNTKNSFVF
jgi:hypothetical protein